MNMRIVKWVRYVRTLEISAASGQAMCVAGVFVVASALVGCESGGSNLDRPGLGAHVESSRVKPSRGPLPTYESVRMGYNARVDRLERLQCSLSITATTINQEGEEETNTAEGYLVVERPSRIALRVDKAGQSIAYLGANEESVWSFDLSSNPKVATISARADAEVGSAKGQAGVLPVDPRVLVDLLGVTPLPARESELVLPIAWAPRDAVAGVEGAGSSTLLRVVRKVGRQRLVMDISPRDFVLVRSTVFDADGSVAGKAAYSRDGAVEVRGDRISLPRMAEAIVVDVPAWGAKIRLRLVSPQNPAERLRSQAFDLDGLLKAYDITDIRKPK